MSHPTQIFISYRRSDTEVIVDRIYEELIKVYGDEAVFKDTNSIPFGSNFPDYIQDKLSQTKIFLLVIGKTFLSSKDEKAAPRLFDEKDFVRIEIETALKLGITIIPVLDKEVSYPAAKELPASITQIVNFNAFKLGGPGYFKFDMLQLIKAIDSIIHIKSNDPPPFAPKKSIKRKTILPVILLIAVCMGSFMYYQSNQSSIKSDHLVPALKDSHSLTRADTMQSTTPEKNKKAAAPGQEFAKDHFKQPVKNHDSEKELSMQMNTACNISNIEFIDAETFDDNLTFTETGRNQYSFSGRIGHRFDVQGKAILKGSRLSLYAGNSSGDLQLTGCNNIRGVLKTGDANIMVSINYIKALSQ